MDTNQEVKKRKGVLGLVIGGALGIFFVSMFVRTFAVEGFPIFSPMYPPVYYFTGLVIGALVGNIAAKNIGGVPAVPVATSILLSIILWPSAIFGIHKVDEYKQKRLINDFEMFPEATLDRVESVVYRDYFSGSEKGISKILIAPMGTTEQKIKEFYLPQYINKGWTLLENNEKYMSHRILQAKKGNLTSSVYVTYQVECAGGHISLSREEAINGYSGLCDTGKKEEVILFHISTP